MSGFEWLVLLGMLAVWAELKMVSRHLRETVAVLEKMQERLGHIFQQVYRSPWEKQYSHEELERFYDLLERTAKGVEQAGNGR